MRPKSDNIVYRPDLGEIVFEYVESAAMSYIGLQVMPIYNVEEDAGTFMVIPEEALLKLSDTKRSARGRYNRDDWEYEAGKYATSENGWEEPVDDSERAKIEGRTGKKNGLADTIAVKRAMIKVLRQQEKRIADKVFNSTNFTAHAITNEWDDSSNATPIDDVKTGKSTIRSACGMLPNTLIISWSTSEDLKNCDQIIDRIKYTFPGMDMESMTAQHLARVFNVPKVMIGGAVYDSAGKGLDASIANLWNNEYAMLTITSDSPDISQACLGRTFLYSADSPSDAVVESYREEQTRSDVFRVRHNTDERLIQSFDSSDAVKSNIASNCSYLMSNITT